MRTRIMFFGAFGLAGAGIGWSPSALGSDLHAFDRHEVVVIPGTRPPGVPPSFVLTRHGFFDPSCVIRLRSDESIDDDGVIRDMTGRLRERVGRCVYPHFDRLGRAVTAPAPAARAHANDGWVTHFFYDQMFAFGDHLTVSTTWAVPEDPAKLDRQDIALFNGLQTQDASGALNIMQPVLELNGNIGRWWIIAEYCCLPMDVQTQPIIVATGDTIRGELAGTNCRAGACQDWTITATSLISGQMATLHRSGLPTVVDVLPAVLETSDVTSCDMLPASGRTVFSNHRVTDGTGMSLVFPYRLAGLLLNPPPELPRDCGWGGSSPAADTFVLTYGKTPIDVDAGASERPADGPADRLADEASNRDVAPSTPNAMDADASVAATTRGGCQLIAAGESPAGADIAVTLAVALLVAAITRRRRHAGRRLTE